MFDGAPIRAVDEAHALLGAAHRELLSSIGRLVRSEAWREQGARDPAHFLSIRYGLSDWKARRWIAAAFALEHLPGLAAALSRGTLGIDKLVELTRFATPDSEQRLLVWAQRVSCGAIRRRADLEAKATAADVIEPTRSRSLGWWYFDEGRRFALEAELPAAEGAVVARALERVARTIPRMPDDDEATSADARRADALVAVCSAQIAVDGSPDRATVVIHAQANGLEQGIGGCEVEDGPVIHPTSVRRALCNARTQVVLEDELGNVLGLGRARREPPAWMLRQVRYRDRECRFPGCGMRRFTEAHHLRWWRHGGRTELGNLALICSFHHRLVHEQRWSVRRRSDGEMDWFRPDGTRYRAGPSPGDPPEQQLDAFATG
jgi:Domain of unknown function (DUF222)